MSRFSRWWERLGQADEMEDLANDVIRRSRRRFLKGAALTPAAVVAAKYTPAVSEQVPIEYVTPGPLGAARVVQLGQRVASGYVSATTATSMLRLSSSTGSHELGVVRPYRYDGARVDREALEVWRRIGLEP